MVAARDDDVFSGGGDAGRDLTSVDWSRTPLGPVETWPQSLKTAVRIMLTSRYAMWMAWGRGAHVLLQRRLQADTLGVKHPWALGSRADRVWAEIWPDIGPRIETVLKTGMSTWDERLLLFLERSGYPEETYHTFSYSPLSDDGGAISGMLCVVTEDTERVIGERRLGTLRDLGAQATQAKTTERGLPHRGQRAGREPEGHPVRPALHERRGRWLGDASRVEPARQGGTASPDTIDLTDDEAPSWPVAEAIRTALPVPVPDLRARFGDLPGGPWKHPPNEAMVLPIRESEARVSGALVVGVNPCRAIDEGYRTFFELAVRQISTTIGNARAYDEEKRRAEALAELDRAKTAFFSNVSHEFRTPLTLLLGPVEDMLAKPEDEIPPEDRELLTVVHRNALRLQKLVNTLLDFSRIEAGRVQASYEPTDLAGLTADLASVFRSAVEKAGMRLDRRLRAAR